MRGFYSNIWAFGLAYTGSSAGPNWEPRNAFTGNDGNPRIESMNFVIYVDTLLVPYAVLIHVRSIL